MAKISLIMCRRRRTKVNPFVQAHRKPKSHQITEDITVGEDHISKLPDDILIQILSLQTMEEAARSSILSRRWANLFTRIPLIKFGSKETFYRVTREKSRAIAASKFVRRVNQVLGSYGGQTLEEFSIYFDLNKRNKSDIDKWVEFAFANQVRKFELGFYRFRGEEKYRYSLPSFGYHELVRLRDAGFNCTRLTALRLEGVNVTGEQIEFCLNNCPCLESVCLIGSETFGKGLKVDGSIRLKHLEIIDCILQNLEISVPNLTYLKFETRMVSTTTAISMPLKYPPQLVEIFAGGSLYECLLYDSPSFTGYLQQLETLTLVMDTPFLDHEPQWPSDIPILINLKQLTVKCWINNDDCIMGFTSWIEASPLLQRFVLQGIFLFPATQREEAKAPKKFPHENLKEVEFKGFVGEPVDSELAAYVIENAVNLEKIVFDCRTYLIQRKRGKARRAAKGKARAMQFQLKLKPTVDFVLIPLEEDPFFKMKKGPDGAYR